MSDLDFVLWRVQKGGKVRVVQDRYGQEKVEVRRPWLPLTTRLELPRDELNQVKAALGLRGRKSRPTVAVTF